MVINGFILDNSGIKITQSIKMRKDDFHFKREIVNGSFLPSILLRGYHGIFFGKSQKSHPKTCLKIRFPFFFYPENSFSR